ncbi:MAG: threonylcarbamoyl-AMP synthase [Bdellovibrionales bacterium RIFCSPHIGHO2_01_FULL_40_29]|nr:MAG: threonylcarbamoyl-AMP synthase [Bdellovibrionales bacterium RIFCSPHIGHO2_01_FULL_40_29]OFZ32895.1 MAG: threonylcarbamoyl-AMP synthase [Bdellovibrionales bacterium RIFCSPHIGHO2_02_FULL_40_15]
MSTQLEIATELIKNEDVVAFPTETVYGLGARIDSRKAVEKIFTTKQRPFFDPLIVHVASIQQAQECTTDFNPLVQVLAEKFWPGPLTLVIPKSEKISDVITSGLQDVGIRFPNHPIALQLIQAVGVPIAAPSANKFGRTSPTTAQHVRHEFGDAVFVMDGEPSQIGIESTVLAVKSISDEKKYQLCILRKGFVTRSQIDELLKPLSFNYSWVDHLDKKSSPGNMKHHYMPSVPFVICRNTAMKLSELNTILNSRLSQLPDQVEGVTLIKPKGQINKIEFLKLPTDPVLAARELYSLLRLASLRSPQVLCFIQLPSQIGEMWESVFDRLYKAASLILD